MLGLGSGINRLSAAEAAAIAGRIPGFTGLLDESYGASAEAAYSVRRLTNRVSVAMTIRRDSDSTETDIGFDANGNIDEAAITAFCTGTTCRVASWKDQSGNDNHAVQAVASNQPTIYTGGALVKENGRVAVDFDGSNDELTHSISGLVNGNFTYIDTFKSSDAAAILHSSTTTNTKWVMFAQTSTNTALSDGFLTAYDGYFKNGVQPLSSGATRTDFTNAFFDGGQNLAFYFGTTNGIAVSQMYMGRYQQSGLQFDGLVQESILYTSDKSTDRTSIESNIGGYFTQNTPLLDTYSGAAAAYSLRKLSSSYSGPAIRVRRDNDNLETDINFNVFGELDTVSLAAHCGSNNGYVTNWYDQSSNSNTAIQTTAANQPQIVSSGAVIVDASGKPALDFTGSQELLSPSITTASQPVTAISVVDTTNSPTSAASWFYSLGQSLYASIEDNSSAMRMYAGTTFVVGPLGGTNTQRLDFSLFDGANSEIWLNGNSILTGNPGTNGISSIRIGGLNGPRFEGLFAELIAYPSDESSNRTNIQDNINTFYSIY